MNFLNTWYLLETLFEASEFFYKCIALRTLNFFKKNTCIDSHSLRPYGFLQTKYLGSLKPTAETPRIAIKFTNSQKFAYPFGL